MQNLQAISELITKWKLNQTMLAERLGIPKATFANNLKGRKYYSFTDEQLGKLKSVLIELRSDIEAMDDLDFNEALRLISQKEV